MSLRTIARYTSLALIGIALSTALFGCIQVGPTAEPVTITFACSEEEEEHYAALFEVFQKENRHREAPLGEKTVIGLSNRSLQQ